MATRKQTPDVLAAVLGGDEVEFEQRKHSAGKRNPEAAEAARPTWEYALVSCQDYKGWRPRYINGHELSDWTNGPLIHEYIEQMGADGWELAAASSGERLYGSSDLHQLYFKRPK